MKGLEILPSPPFCSKFCLRLQTGPNNGRLFSSLTVKELTKTMADDDQQPGLITKDADNKFRNQRITF